MSVSVCLYVCCFFLSVFFCFFLLALLCNIHTIPIHLPPQLLLLVESSGSAASAARVAASACAELSSICTSV
jgi:hypothetical protein